MKENKRYSKEFKLDSISLVKEQGYSRIEAQFERKMGKLEKVA